MKLRLGENIVSIKAQLRKEALAARAAIEPASASEKTKKAIERIKAHPAYKTANILFVYSACGSEMNLDELYKVAKVQGKTLCYPVCDGRGGMCAAVPDDEGHWQTDRYGIKEPVLAYSAILSPSAIDLVLTPGVAFDRRGSRIGYGAGYYDRFLPLCKKAFVMGVAFEEQIHDSWSTDEHDRSMNAVVSDTDLYE